MRDVKPLLDRHGVTAYFFGHDHDLQHIVGGRRALYRLWRRRECAPTSMITGSRFASDHPGFFSGQIVGDTLRFAFIGDAGETL